MCVRACVYIFVSMSMYHFEICDLVMDNSLHSRDLDWLFFDKLALLIAY